MNEAWLQITAGQGPAECALAVVKVLEEVRWEALVLALTVRVVEIEPGEVDGTISSALLHVAGDGVDAFLRSWEGSVQWIARSPYRPGCKRKNWFIGIEAMAPVEETHFDPKEVRVETMRASGAGGQHVNRTESAVRVTHVPSGIQASASEERSQHRNRKLAMARLARKLVNANASQHAQAREQRWAAHQRLERGNPIRVLRE